MIIMEKKVVQTFNHEKFGSIRTCIIDGEPWFIAKDIAGALGYTNTKKAILDHVDEEDIIRVNFGGNDSLPSNKTRGGLTYANVINESGMYSLVLRSNLPRSKKFKRWVTKDVLPAIRKYGVYINKDHDVVRHIGIAIRNNFTRAVKVLTKHFAYFGHKAPENLYANLTTFINSITGIETGASRDKLDSYELMKILAIESYATASILYSVYNNHDYAETLSGLWNSICKLNEELEGDYLKINDKIGNEDVAKILQMAKIEKKIKSFPIEAIESLNIAA